MDPSRSQKSPTPSRIAEVQLLTLDGECVRKAAWDPRDVAHFLQDAGCNNHVLRAVVNRDNHLDCFCVRDRWLLSEHYERKPFFRDSGVHVNEAENFLRHYARNSIAEVNEWYRPNLNWKNGYFRHHTLFEVVNKRHRVRSLLAQGIFLLAGILIAIAVFISLAPGGLGVRGAILALVFLVLLVDRKFDFREKRKSSY